jgi:hypothetical protein
MRFELPDRAALSGDLEIEERIRYANIDWQYEINNQ